MGVFDLLAHSNEAADRDYAVSALIDIARFRPEVIPLQLVHLLVHDDDPAVASQAEQLVELISDVTDDSRRWAYSRFGI